MYAHFGFKPSPDPWGEYKLTKHGMVAKRPMFERLLAFIPTHPYIRYERVSEYDDDKRWPVGYFRPTNLDGSQASAPGGWVYTGSTMRRLVEAGVLVVLSCEVLPSGEQRPWLYGSPLV